MNFTFKSESYGVQVEINFRADTLDEIEEMYKQFLKGSGFHFVEDDTYKNPDTGNPCERWDNEAKPEQKIIGWINGEPQYAKPEQAEKQEPEQKPVSTNDHLCAMLRQVHDVLACTALPMKRKWVGLTHDEVLTTWLSPDACKVPQCDKYHHFYLAIEAKLKEKNGA